jgi:hypothetical protein
MARAMVGAVIRTRVCLALCAALALTACSGAKPFPSSAHPSPKDALTTLKDAASHSEASPGATFSGTMSADNETFARISGVVDLRGRTLSLETSPAVGMRPYQSFESRVVGGWQYVEISPSVVRPPTLRPSVKWVAFKGHPKTLPVPDRTIPPSAVLDLLDKLDHSQIAKVHFVDPTTDGRTRVEFEVPGFATGSIQLSYTVTIDSEDRLAEFVSVTRVPVEGGEHVQSDDLTFAWATSVVTTLAPPAADVQRLAPGEDLYANGGSTTTTTVLPDGVAGNQGLFDSERTRLETALRAQSDPTLTDFSFDARQNEIEVHFTYARPVATTSATFDDFAWQVSEKLADTFWSSELMDAVRSLNGDATWLPNLYVKIDTKIYNCSSEVQLAVAAHRMSRSDWLAKCRI